MRLNILNKASHYSWSRATIIIVAVFAAGCSQDTLRFSSDNTYKKSNSYQKSAEIQHAHGSNKSNNTAFVSVSRHDARRPETNGTQKQLGLDYQHTASINRGGQAASGYRRNAAYTKKTAAHYQHSPVDDCNYQALPEYRNANFCFQTAYRKKRPDVPPIKESLRQRGVYIVHSGDTLYSIAHKTGAPLTAIKQVNRLNHNIIYAGQKLYLPESVRSNFTGTEAPTLKDESVALSRGPAVKFIGQNAAVIKKAAVQDGVSGKSKPASQARKTEDAVVQDAIMKTKKQLPRTGITDKTATKHSKNKFDATHAAVIAPQSTGIGQMRWPAEGRILSAFGNKAGLKTNDGIDIMLPEGSSVKAAENGIVIYADSGLKDFGNTVLVKHENNTVTVYAHNSRIMVRRGQGVRRGEEIAKSGFSGNAGTPRLHFEVRKNSTPVNPIHYLENRKY